MNFDSDITICSDDFKFDDETATDDGTTFNELNNSQTSNVSVNLLEGVDMFLMGKEVETNLSENLEDNQINDKINNDELSQSTYCEDVQSQHIIEGNILQNEDIRKENNKEVNNNFNKDIINNINNTQSLPFDSQQTIVYYNKERNISQSTISSKNNHQINNNENVTVDLNKKNNYSNNLTLDNNQMQFDSQETELYSYQFNDIPKMQEFKDISNKEVLEKKIKNNNMTTFDSQETNFKSFPIHEYSNDAKYLEANTNIRENQQIDTQDKESYLYITQSQSQFIEVKENHLYNLYKTKNKQPNVGFNQTLIYENVGSTNIPNRSNASTSFDKHPDLLSLEGVQVKNKSDLGTMNRQTQNEEMYETDSIDNIEVNNSTFEIVPFKIIDELNRLKMYLERRCKETEGSWSDSGYKSDSQSRSSFKPNQQTQDTLVNHSARSVLDFILNSPLVLAAKGIVNEISCVLGRLIDKLYLEEKYFLFLEEVLSSIDNLLKNIYEGESFDEDVIMKKDDHINRLFLINRSNHSIKYTIEKITIILEKYLSQTPNDLYEINNTSETENLSYILHILECLLKRYIVNKNVNSQCDRQCTQEEKYLKKSSVSDIWRKKWNPSYKAAINSVIDKKSIEIKCMEVLNKIIVQSMEGYSLISFSALQCFNLLQS